MFVGSLGQTTALILTRLKWSVVAFSDIEDHVLGLDVNAKPCPASATSGLKRGVERLSFCSCIYVFESIVDACS